MLGTRLVCYAVGSLLITSCTGGPSPTSAPSPPGAESPKAAVEGLVAALAAAEWDATAPWVDEEQVVLLASIEGMSLAETEALLSGGLTSDVRANFWEGFVDAFPLFAKEEISELLIGDVVHLEVVGGSFAAVQITLRSSPGVGALMVRQEGGRWLVDLLATIGPAVASPLRRWLEAVPHDEPGRTIRASVAAQRPSFESALEYQPLGEVSEAARFEVRLLIVEATG